MDNANVTIVQEAPCSDGRGQEIFSAPLNALSKQLTVVVTINRVGSEMVVTGDLAVGGERAHREFRAPDRRCSPIASAIRAWATIAGDRLLENAETSGDLGDRGDDPSPESNPLANARRPAATPNSITPTAQTKAWSDDGHSVQEERGPRTGGLEFAVSTLVSDGLGAGAMVGGAISMTSTTSDVFLRPGFAYGRSASGSHASWAAVFAEGCKRVRGGYEKQPALSFDGCLHAELADLQVREQLAVFSLGGAATIRGQLSEHIALELRTIIVANFSRDSFYVDTLGLEAKRQDVPAIGARGELGVLWSGL